MAQMIGRYTVDVVAWVGFMYLRSLSFNQVIAILRARYKKDIFTKGRLIAHLEQLADRIPSNEKITTWLQPERSGYYAIDGLWTKYRGADIVILILFDVETLDIVAYAVADDETERATVSVINQAYDEISATVQGFYCDGEPGILKAIRKKFPHAPLQLCVFHKYTRVKQIIPFTRPKNTLDTEIKDRVRKILFASTKEEAIQQLHQLKQFAKEHSSYEKLRVVVGALQRNFNLILTHFDYPAMSPYNNVLEGFNHIVKRRLRLMKGFKKSENIHRWLKLIMLDWRFHEFKETAFGFRRNKSPLQLAHVDLPKIYNWLTFVRKQYRSSPVTTN